MDNREQLRPQFETDAAPYGFSFERYCTSLPTVEPWNEYKDDDTGHRWGGWLACAEQKDKEFSNTVREMLVLSVDAENASKELKELKDEINRVWYLAYPESPQTDKDVAKMRVFNLYQDLVCTRDNYRFLNNAWNKLNEEVKK